MPAPLPPIEIPDDALSKSAPDFYANLSDEEREEEELPPREAPPKEEAKPAESAPADEPEEEDGEDEIEAAKADDATQIILDEIAGLHQKLDDRGVDAKAPKTEAQRDELMERLLEHEDPDMRGLAERLQKAEAAYAALEDREWRRVVAAQVVQDNADKKDLRTNYTIEGKKVTAEHIELVEDYFKAHREVAAVLSWEEAARRVHPSLSRVDKESSPKGRPVKKPATDLGGGQPTATIVDTAASGGAPAGQWKPRPGETMDSAIAAAKERLFGIRPT